MPASEFFIIEFQCPDLNLDRLSEVIKCSKTRRNSQTPFLIKSRNVSNGAFYDFPSGELGYHTGIPIHLLATSLLYLKLRMISSSAHGSK